jgi:hypothetical protein
MDRYVLNRLDRGLNGRQSENLVEKSFVDARVYSHRPQLEGVETLMEEDILGDKKIQGAPAR